MKRLSTCVLLALVSIACSVSKGSLVYSPPAVAEGVPATGASQRVVIRSGSLTIKARELEPVREKVVSHVEGRNGWVDDWSIEDRWLRMTVRVPTAELDRSLDYFSSLGKVISRGFRSRDVTERLVDLELRLKNLIALRARLRAYLDQTQDLKEILEVESQLNRVQTEIESIEGKLKVLRAQIEMSEIELRVKRRR